MEKSSSRLFAHFCCSSIAYPPSPSALVLSGGKKEIMEVVAPAGPMYQAGTLSGNPLAMTAGIKTLEILKRPGSYEVSIIYY